MTSAEQENEIHNNGNPAQETSTKKKFLSFGIRIGISAGVMLFVLWFYVPFQDRMTVIERVEVQKSVNDTTESIKGNLVSINPDAETITIRNADGKRTFQIDQLKKINDRPFAILKTKTRYGSVQYNEEKQTLTINKTSTYPIQQIKKEQGKPFVPGLFRTWQQMQLIYAIPAFLLLPIMQLITIYRWQLLLRTQNIGLSFPRALQYTYIGFFWNNMALGLTGGDVAKAYLIGSKAERKAGALLSVFVDRFIGLISLLLIALVASCTLFHVQPIRRVGMVLIAFFAALFIFVYLFFYSSIRTNEWIQWIKTHLPFQNAIQATDQAAKRYGQNPSNLLFPLLLSLIVQIISISACVLFGLSLGIREASLTEYVVYFPVAKTISALPISAAGWGVGEASFVYLFGLAGVSGAGALTLSVIYRLSRVFWSLPGGIMMALPTGENVTHETSF